MPAGVHVLLPGAAGTPTGGFLYDRMMLQALRRAGRLEGVLVVAGSWPEPAAATVALARRLVAALPDGAALLVDGLAFSPLLEVFEAEAGHLRLYALVHHPLADETGLAAPAQDRLFERERRALALARGVIATSAATARRLDAGFGVAAKRIRVVQPGVGAAGNAGTPRRGRPAAAPLLLCVATLTPRKGQHVLLRALAGLRRQPWRLRLVGQARNRAYASRLRRQAHALRLSDRIEFAGIIPPAALTPQYRAADVFVLPSFHEGFGIALAEAAAFRLPIIAGDAGAIAEAVAGARHWLVPPGDPRALAAALRRWLWRHRNGGSRGTSVKPRSWERAGREFVAALSALGA